MSEEFDDHDGEANVRERRYLVDQNYVGMRLDQFLAARIPRISRSFAAEIVRYGNVEVIPARKIKAGTRLRMDDTVVLRQTLEKEVVQDEEARILFADDGLVIVNKPAGMLVHESASVRLNTVTHYLMRQGFREAEPAHRIDRETSGIVVCAARRELVAELRGQFATSHPDKIYRALVLDPDEIWQPGMRKTLDTPLGLDEGSILGVRMGRGHLDARTHVHVLERREHSFGVMADLEIAIETGRQHQIRVHLAMEGTPIAGDKLYGKDDAFFMAICDRPDDPVLLAELPFGRQALHAWRMGLTHPITGERVRFEAPLPQIW
jgi:RluA family pseudouridine synthase